MTTSHTPSEPSRGRRTVTSFLVVLWLAVYLALAWYVGSSLVPDDRLWQIIYFPIAGLLWVPVAIRIMKWGARAPG